MRRSPLARRLGISRSVPLKRGGPIARKTPVKRGGFIPRTTPLRQKSIGDVATEKDRAWEWCSRYVRLLRRIPGTDTARCVTCDRVYLIHGRGCIQAGHAFGGRGNAVLYDVRVIWPQCPICNRWHRGEYVKFEMFLRTKLSLEEIEAIKIATLKAVPMTAFQHREMGEMFRLKVEALGGWPW